MRFELNQRIVRKKGESLRANQIDLALMLRPPNGDEIEFRPLFSDSHEFYVAPMHPWANKKSTIKLDRRSETFILYHKGTYTYRMVMDYLTAAGIEIKKPIEMGSMEAAKELVKIGLGVGVFARWVAKKEIAKNSLIAWPLGLNPLRREWGFGYLRGRKLGMAEETFLGLFESAVAMLDLDLIPE